MELIKNTNSLLSGKDKDDYFKKYMENKILCRYWLSRYKKSRVIRTHNTKRIILHGTIWENIIEEQLYEPSIQSKIFKRIW